MLSVHLEAFIAHSTHQESQAELIQNIQLKNNEIQLCLLQCFHSNILNDVFSLLAPWCLFPFCFICLLFFSVARFSFICCKALPHLLLLSCTSNVLYCKPAVLMTDEMYTAWWHWCIRKKRDGGVGGKWGKWEK